MKNLGLCVSRRRYDPFLVFRYRFCSVFRGLHDGLVFCHPRQEIQLLVGCVKLKPSYIVCGISHAFSAFYAGNCDERGAIATVCSDLVKWAWRLRTLRKGRGPRGRKGPKGQEGPQGQQRRRGQKRDKERMEMREQTDGRPMAMGLKTVE